MSIDLRVDGSFRFYKPGNPQPFRYQLSEYSVSEDATPLDGGDSSGGTNQLTFSVMTDPDLDGTPLTFGRRVEIVDSEQGNADGYISRISMAGGVSSITALGRTASLVAEATVPPYTGTLAGAFRYYLSRVGISSGRVFTSAALESRSVAYPGFEGDVWTALKEMCVAEEVEIIQRDDDFYLLVLPTTETITPAYNTSAELSIESPQLAKAIEIYNYNNTQITNQIVWPSPRGWVPDAEVLTVEAFETVEYDLEIDGSLTSVQQPTCVDAVWPDYTASSRYAVGGNDGLMVPAEQWKKQGGRLTVKINPGGNSLHITLTGAGYKALSPYKIAMVTETTEYSSLRIVGTGVRYNKELITIPTGVNPDATDTDIGVTVDNRFISDFETAWRVGTKTAQRFAGPTMSLSVSTPNAIKRQTDGTFPEQISYLAGQRLTYGASQYRVKSASISPTEVSYTAERYNTFNNLNSVLSGVTTFNAWNALWAPVEGKTRTFDDMAIEPLRKSAT